MKKLLYVVLLSGIAFLGFSMGRATGMLPETEVPQTNNSYPLPPPPPESTPYVPGTLDGDEDPEQGIVIETPVEGARITGEFGVTGRAKADVEEVLVVSVKSATGGVLYRGDVEVKRDPGARFGRFDTVVGPFEDAEEAVVEVFWMSEDGSESGKQIRTISLGDPDTIEVQVYFQNADLDPTATCELVFLVTRSVSSKTQIYRAAIEALLEGPTDEEADEGFNTSLPKRVTLKSVAADAEGVVTADFDDRLDRGVAGSCRVIAIREQIERTLLQFPEVREVIISVEGETETVLQP